MKIGFLIIDMQVNNIQNQMDQNKVDEACEHINHVSDLLRTNDQIVIHVQDIEGMQESNKAQFDIIEEIQVNDKDLKLNKEYSNAFWKTELEQILLDHDVKLLIISGLAAEQCVQFTYNGAIERGFKPVLLQNGILSTYSDAIMSTYRDRNLISYPVVEYLISNL